MDPATENQLKALADEREEALGAFLRASERLGRLVAQTSAPKAEIASVLGVSRQAVYNLASKWKGGETNGSSDQDSGL